MNSIYGGIIFIISGILFFFWLYKSKKEVSDTNNRLFICGAGLVLVGLFVLIKVFKNVI